MLYAIGKSWHLHHYIFSSFLVCPSRPLPFLYCFTLRVLHKVSAFLLVTSYTRVISLQHWTPVATSSPCPPHNYAWKKLPISSRFVDAASVLAVWLRSFPSSHAHLQRTTIESYFVLPLFALLDLWKFDSVLKQYGNKEQRIFTWINSTSLASGHTSS